LVQLTRKRLGTGLIEAFSTSCPHCGGRGIVLHGDPVDSTSTTGRKSEVSGRRGKRGKRGGKSDDVAVAKVPAHPAGEHPMFKAMAAANGRHEADESTDGEVEEKKASEEAAELDADTIREAIVDTADEELEDEDFDEDEDEAEDSEEDEIDLDADDEDDDIDDDIEVINGDSDDEDSDEDEDDEDYDSDEDENSDDEDDEFDTDERPVAPAPAGRHRRRAAVRPAGPPIHES
jgi:ribonuclease E